jgi:redox-sensitive bicupin YhaK (pirin superfamily)
MNDSDSISGIESLPARRTELGSLTIRRALPRSQRRMVGPWCFLDRYGPLSFASETPMLVAPHPHMGLQTVSWLLEGEILHKDSLGFEALMRAGQLNLMTSGHGIAHSEETPKQNTGRLSGVQLWVALPRDHRDTSPVFDHYASLPAVDLDSVSMTIIAGELLGHSSPARVFSEIVGADIAFHERKPILLPLQPDYEHALFVLEGDVFIGERRLENDTLHYIGANRSELQLAGSRNSRLLLLGGRPFGEPIMMWWNFVARTPEEIAQAREDWMQHRRFGDVKAYSETRLPAPDLGKFAPANPAS